VPAATSRKEPKRPGRRFHQRHKPLHTPEQPPHVRWAVGAIAFQRQLAIERVPVTNRQKSHMQAFAIVPGERETNFFMPKRGPWSLAQRESISPTKNVWYSSYLKGAQVHLAVRDFTLGSRVGPQEDAGTSTSELLRSFTSVRSPPLPGLSRRPLFDHFFPVFST